MTPCPYCQHPDMPPPPRTPRPYGRCPACGLKSRAVIWGDADGTTYYRYVTTARPSQHMRVKSFRLRPDQIAWLATFPDESEYIRQTIDKDKQSRL